ncbi:hypothetical protein D3C85_1454510 [compost metagenome]
MPAELRAVAIGQHHSQPLAAQADPERLPQGLVAQLGGHPRGQDKGGVPQRLGAGEPGAGPGGRGRGGLGDAGGRLGRSRRRNRHGQAAGQDGKRIQKTQRGAGMHDVPLQRKPDWLTSR